MSVRYRVGVFVGSLRRESFSRRIAHSLVAAAPPSLETSFVEIGDLPLYNLDLEAAPPRSWTVFRESVRELDGLLFVTPEFNRGMTGAMKNAIDVGSAPQGRNAWEGKPAGVVSVTPGALGAMASHHEVRTSLFAVGVPVLPLPEMYIGGVVGLLGPDGSVVNPSTRELLALFMRELAAWIARNAVLRPDAVEGVNTQVTLRSA